MKEPLRNMKRYVLIDTNNFLISEYDQLKKLLTEKGYSWKEIFRGDE